jgi:hypothetical protein
MNSDASPDNPSGKQKILPGWAVWPFKLLRMFWLTELAWLIVYLYGLRAGWSTPRQWSDGLFIGASGLILVAAVAMFGSRGDALDAYSMRYVEHANITETLRLLSLESMRKIRFGMITFLGGLLTMLVAGIVLWV